MVGQGLEEFNDVGLLLLAQVDAADQIALVGVGAAVTGQMWVATFPEATWSSTGD